MHRLSKSFMSHKAPYTKCRFLRIRRGAVINNATNQLREHMESMRIFHMVIIELEVVYKGGQQRNVFM